MHPSTVPSLRSVSSSLRFALHPLSSHSSHTLLFALSPPSPPAHPFSLAQSSWSLPQLPGHSYLEPIPSSPLQGLSLFLDAPPSLLLVSHSDTGCRESAALLSAPSTPTQKTMDNGNFQSTAHGVYPQAPKTYEPLEMEVGVPSRSHPQGVGVTSTVVNVTSYGPQPRDHIIWSLFSTIYMNFCCLGFMALVYSVKARDRKVVGDMNGASSYGSTAKWLNITALVLTLLFFILIIILITSGVIVIATQIQKIEQHQTNEDIFGRMSGK